MAITLDSTSHGNNGGSASSLTVSHTMLGSGIKQALVVFVRIDSPNVVDAVTYAGVSMTLVNTISGVGGGPWPSNLFCYRLYNPTFGTNNIVATCTGNHALEITAAGYNNVYTGYVRSPIMGGTSASGGDILTSTAGPGNILIGRIIACFSYSYNYLPAVLVPTAGGTNEVVDSYGGGNGATLFDYDIPGAGTYSIGGTLTGSATGSLELNYIALVQDNTPYDRGDFFLVIPKMRNTP